MSDAHRPAAKALRLALSLGALLAVAAAQAQQPPLAAGTSVDALVAALRGGGGPTTRSFRRTQLPDASSSLCAAPAPVAPEGRRALSSAAGPRTRTLEVVPYAGDTTPGVNLSVQFAHGSDKLTPNDRALLDQLAQALQSPTLAQDRFAVAGHTDSTGDARINLELSCARALAVQRYLEGKGIAPERLSAYGFGQTRLLMADQPTDGANRRVEVRKAPE